MFVVQLSTKHSIINIKNKLNLVFWISLTRKKLTQKKMLHQIVYLRIIVNQMSFLYRIIILVKENHVWMITFAKITKWCNISLYRPLQFACMSVYVLEFRSFRFLADFNHRLIKIHWKAINFTLFPWLNIGLSIYYEEHIQHALNTDCIIICLFVRQRQLLAFLTRMPGGIKTTPICQYENDNAFLYPILEKYLNKLCEINARKKRNFTSYATIHDGFMLLWILDNGIGSR